MNREGQGRFRAFSAGSDPTGCPNPHAVKLLQGLGYDTGRLRSKCWDEFAGTGVPEMNFVFTVCDAAAEETCPIWPGHPTSAHWGLPDPAAANDDKAKAAFQLAYAKLYRRIKAFLDLPKDQLTPEILNQKLHEIGRSSN